MTTVTLTATVGGAGIPVTVTAGYALSLIPESGPPLTVFIPGSVTPLEAVFSNVAPGLYVTSAELLTAPGGTLLAAAPTGTVTVPSSVTLQGPIGIHASVTFA